MPVVTEPFMDVFVRVLNHPLITLGGGSLTLAIIIQLLSLCLFVLAVENMCRRYFITRLLRHTALDPALQYGISRIGGYFFILFGFYVALTAVGINLSSLAVVAGAIGIGIGFGLQNIFQNFVSGIIILAERPIALGDRIEIGGVAGIVNRISLRSTEILTNDNISIIVPNSDFVTHPVTNWSHGDPRVRIRVPVGVAYGTDIEHLKSLLMSVASEDNNVLKTPEPSVFFESFGESALQFELAVWTSSMTHSPRRFKSDLNYAIERKLRENKIEIPFPQREIHVRSDSRPLPGTPP